MRILAVILVLIAYGSLYPGNFSAPPAGSVEEFLTDFRWFTSLGDVLGNIALFFPLGMAGILLMPGKGDSSNRIPGLLVLALVYALALQLAQVWLPSRSAAMADVMWNMTGTVLGIIVGMAVPRLAINHESKTGQTVVPHSLLPLSILGLWLLMELVPLVPSLDWQKFKDALKPLVQDLHFSFPQAMMHGAGMLVAGSMLLALGWFSSVWLGTVLVVVLAGKVMVVGRILDISTVIGMFAGYLGCLYVPRLRRSDPTIIFEAAFVLLLVAWTLVGITPFLPVSGGTFNGIPFAPLLQGSMEDAAKGLAESLFIYTSLLWLAQNTGISLKKVVVGLFVWSSLIELVQMGLLGRTADVTEPLLVLLLGWMFPILQAKGLPGRVAAVVRAPQAMPRVSTPTSPFGAKMPTEISPKYGLAQLLAGITIGTALVWFVTQSSFVPYNVRELIYEGHPFRSALLLALLMFWTIGFPVLILYWLAKDRRYLPTALPLILVHGFVAWLLLWSSVPTESLHDIVGAPVLRWPWEWELLGRFIALFSVWSIAAMGGCLAAAWRILPNAKWLLLAWAISCLLIPISYHVVIVEAATDNLVELIAGTGSVPAFFLISLAAGIITFGGAKLALALIGTAPLTQAVALALTAGVLSYTALYFGLEQVIVKYQQVFSAMQFLLSADRANLAGPAELLVRYGVLYMGFIITVVVIQNPLWRWALSGLLQFDPATASPPTSGAKANN